MQDLEKFEMKNEKDYFAFSALKTIRTLQSIKVLNEDYLPECIYSLGRGIFENYMYICSINKKENFFQEIILSKLPDGFVFEKNENGQINYNKIKLINKHGLDIIRPSYKSWSNEDKEEAVHRVIFGKESVNSVAIDIGLKTKAALQLWIKTYIKNGYTIVTKKKGRPRTRVKGKEDDRGTGEGNPGTSPEELEAYNRELIRKKIECLSSKEKGPRTEEKVAVIDELRQSKNYPLKYLLIVSGLSKSTYEYYKTDKHLNYINRKKEEDDSILAIITPAFEHHKSRYGYRRIILAKLEGLEKYGHHRIQRVMSENGLKAKQGKNGKYHSYKGDNGEFKENLLLQKEVDKENNRTKYIRDFDTSKPNEKWTTDVSEFKSDEGKVYLSPKALFHGKMYSFYEDSACLGSFVGSSNLGSFWTPNSISTLHLSAIFCVFSRASGT